MTAYEFVTTRCAYGFHERCDDLACMCGCHFEAEDPPAQDQPEVAE